MSLYDVNLPVPAKTLRLMALFKLIGRLDDLRTITVTIIQALQSMSYIVLFIVMFGIAFTHIGINLYSDYVNSRAPGLIYQDYFASIGESFETMFILMTLDQWDPINRNLAVITNTVASYVFIIFWTWIGAFIFRNIFVGVMIQNFKRISAIIEAEERAIRQQKRIEKIHERLATELSKKRANSVK